MSMLISDEFSRFKFGDFSIFYDASGTQKVNGALFWETG